MPMGVADWWSRSQSSQTTIHRRSARCTILGWWTFLNALHSRSMPLCDRADPSHGPKRAATVVRSSRSYATIPRTGPRPRQRTGVPSFAGWEASPVTERADAPGWRWV